MASDATIWGMAMEWWELELLDQSDGSPDFRGLRIEPNEHGVLQSWPTWLGNPFLGIHHDGAHMGTRVTLQDLGWVDQ